MSTEKVLSGLLALIVTMSVPAWWYSDLLTERKHQAEVAKLQAEKEQLRTELQKTKAPGAMPTCRDRCWVEREALRDSQGTWSCTGHIITVENCEPNPVREEK